MNDASGAKIADFPTGFDYHFERGRALFRLGEPAPARAWDENGAEVPGITEAEQLVFMGWMIERANQYLRRRKIEDALRPDPDEPRPHRPVRRAAA